MPHEFESGFAREPMWHGLGIASGESLTAEHAVIAAGLDWQVELRDLTFKAGLEDKSTNHYAVVRSSDQSCLGVVGDRFVPLQNTEAFGVVNDLLEEGDLKFDSAGSLRDGKIVFVTAKIPQGVTVLGEEALDLYAVLSHGHDGRHAISLDVTPVLVVCMNTLRLAKSVAKTHASFMHITKGIERSKQAQDILSIVTANGKAVQELAELFARAEISRAAAEDLLSREVYYDLPEKSQRTQVAGTLQTLELSPNIRDAHRGNAWGLFNAVTEWQDWLRPTESDEARVRRCWEGQGRVFRERTELKLRALAG